jgi:hypothetical protein
MGKQYDTITPELRDWIERQRMFFVATAPLAGDGLVNCSPRGLDCLRITGPTEVAWLDLTGSGAETIAHVRENGRIVLMFCAFEGPPKIVRLHGTADILTPERPGWAELIDRFPPDDGARAIIRVRASRISDSCGFGVPTYTFVADRDTLPRWAEAKGPEAIAAYQREKNAVSLDGLPALDAGDPGDAAGGQT